MPRYFVPCMRRAVSFTCRWKNGCRGPSSSRLEECCICRMARNCRKSPETKWATLTARTNTPKYRFDTGSRSAFTTVSNRFPHKPKMVTNRHGYEPSLLTQNEGKQSQTRKRILSEETQVASLKTALRRSSSQFKQEVHPLSLSPPERSSSGRDGGRRGERQRIGARARDLRTATATRTYVLLSAFDCCML